MKNIFFLFLFSFLMFDVATAQEDTRYTEDEIGIQDKFVEAKKYSLIGRYEKAEEILKKLYQDNRSDAIIALELSKVYTKLEDPYNEHKYAQKAAEAAKNNEYIQSSFATICLEQEKFGEAIPVLQSLVSKFPSSEEYSDKLATAFLLQDDDKSALAIYNALESKIGVTENISRRKYEIYEIKGDNKSAVKELESLVNRFPNELRFQHNLAAFYNKMGKDKKALEVYKRILELDINDADANMAVMAASTGGGNDNNYLRSLTPIIDNATIPVDRKVLELVPYIDDVIKKYDQELVDALIMLSDRIVNNHPTEAKAYALKGDILTVANQPKEAIKAYEKTLTLSDKVYTVWEGLMNAQTEVADYENLKNTATEALDLFPNKASAYMYYGRGYAMTGDTEEAIDILEEGVLVSGRDIYNKSNILAELGKAWAVKGDYDKAIENVQKALDMSDNKSAIAMDAMGDVLFRKGDKADAIDFWKKAQKAGLTLPSIQQKIDSKKL